MNLLSNLFTDNRKTVRQDDSAYLEDAIDDNPIKTWADISFKSINTDNQDYEQLTNIYKTDAIARKIVSKPAEDATRNGWRLVIPSDAKKQMLYQAELDKLKLQEVLSKQLIYQRLHGDGYISFGIKSVNGDETKPVDPADVQKLTFVHAFGQTHVSKITTCDDPTSDDYGKESYLTITPTTAGDDIDSQGNVIAKPFTPKSIVLDKSRYAHIVLDRFEDDETGTSIITRCSEQIKAMDIALSTTGKALRDFVFNIMKSDDLLNMSKENRQKTMRQLKHTFLSGSTLFMRNTDSIEKLTTNTSGIDSLFGFLWQDLSTACNIPKSVLTGEQSGTLAGAGQDVINYYDSVKSMQEQLLKPELEYIVKLLMYSQEVGDGYEDPDSIDWHIEFNPLWSADDKTQSETLMNHANAVSTLVSSGIYDIDEARQLFNSQGNNNIQGMQTVSKTDSLDADLGELSKEEKEIVKHGKQQGKELLS